MFLESDAMLLSRNVPKFQMNLLPPSSVQKILKMRSQYVPLKYQYICLGVDGVVSQKTVFFVLCASKYSAAWVLAHREFLRT